MTPGRTTDVSAGTLRARATEAYAQNSRQPMEEKWILDHLPLVRHVVQKVVAAFGQKIDLDDLISAGTLGLVKAARAFDPSRDTEFKTYAYIRIRGAVIDELRGRSMGLAAGRNQLRAVRQAYKRFSAQHGRPPSDEELADELGIALAQLYRTLEEARRHNFLSIHGLGEEDAMLRYFLPPDNSPTPQANLERKELLERLAKAIQELQQRDRLVLLLYYERDLTMKEAAEVLGLTESRVSQLHAAALFKLSMKLKDEG